MKKNVTSIFDNYHLSDSQEEILQRGRYAAQETPPDSVPVVGISPPLNDSFGYYRASDDDSDSDSDTLTHSRYDPVEIEPIRFVSPPPSVDTVDSEEDTADRTVHVESEEVGGDRTVHVESEEVGADRTVPVESEEAGADRTVRVESEEVGDDRTDPVELEEDAANRTVPVESEIENRGSKRMGSTVKEDGGKRVKIPLRDVVKAIVMNSRKTEEEETDKEIEKMSFVQVLIQKGFKFPRYEQNPPRS